MIAKRPANAEAFQSVLFDGSQPEIETCEEPECFGDLNLDQLFAAITADRDGYNLLPLFHEALRDTGAVAYRHEALRDLERQEVRAEATTFARSMREVRTQLGLASEVHYPYERASWLLQAADLYCGAVSRLAEGLVELELTSLGFIRLRDFLQAYVAGGGFMSLAEDTTRILTELEAITYRLQVNGDRVTVARYEGEPDYTVEVQQTFAKFRQGAVEDYRVKLGHQPNLNHVEAAIVELLAKLYPKEFCELRQFVNRHGAFVDDTIRRFDREVQFYLAYLEFIEPFKRMGLVFSYPEVSDGSTDVEARETFDLALANSLRQDHELPVCNDFCLQGSERIFVVSGPNQGGKTTFARMFGQLHYLASLGLPVPGQDARLFLCDQLFTHFEKEEDLENLRGKLEDELVRLRDILRRATSSTIVVINESFASTTVEDAQFLGKEVLGQMTERDMLGVYVTFIDELASLNAQTVSLVSTVVPEKPELRTYKLVRKPADGLAYAMAIAEKHGLTYQALKGRLRR